MLQWLNNNIKLYDFIRKYWNFFALISYEGICNFVRRNSVYRTKKILLLLNNDDMNLQE